MDTRSVPGGAGTDEADRGLVGRTKEEVIKRQRCLSAKHGGTVTVKVNGKRKPLSTFCRFYQNNAPENRAILCDGFAWYPPCPDREICMRRSRASIERDLTEAEK